MLPKSVQLLNAHGLAMSHVDGSIYFTYESVASAKAPSLGPGHPFGPYSGVQLLAVAVAAVAAYGMCCSWLTRWLVHVVHVA